LKEFFDDFKSVTVVKVSDKNRKFFRFGDYKSVTVVEFLKNVAFT